MSKREGRLVLGKCAYTGKTKRNEAVVTFNWDGQRFSAQAEIWNANHTDIVMGGQCLDEVVGLFPDNEKAQRILKVWRKYHLNDMKAGTPAQQAEIERRIAAEKLDRYPEYDTVVEWLKAANLYEVPLTPDMRCTGDFPTAVLEGTRGYRYGERWLHESIPADVVAEIESWF